MKKKATAFILAMVMAVSCVPVAFADGDEAVGLSPENPIILSEESILRDADLNMSFSNLGVGKYKYSSEYYYIENGDVALKIISATWDPAGSNVWIGYYNVNTGNDYGRLYTGGHIYNEGLRGGRMPTGTYRIFVKNLGPNTITGAMQYRVN